MHNLNLEQHNR